MQPNSNYSEANNMLAELHKQRQQRLNPQSSSNTRVQKQIEKWEIEKQSQPLPKLFLAPLIYDTRAERPPHYLNMHRLFNLDPKKKNMGFDCDKKIRSIFMTTFGFEFQVLKPIADIGCNLVVVNQMNGESWNVKQNYLGCKNWTVVQPPKKGSYGVFHTKLWLIKFQDFLRVVVGTGNLHLGDWSVWGNAYWYQDFPLKKSENQTEGSKKTVLLKKDFNQFDINEDFVQTLKLCVNSSLPESFSKQKLNINFNDYIFENIDIVLIPSVAGNHPPQSLGHQGIGKIKKIIKNHFKTSNIQLKNPVMTANSTSLGQLTTDFLKQIYCSFTNNAEFKLSNIKVIYPSQKYVDQQTMVPPDPLFLSKSKYRKNVQTQQVFHKLDVNPQNPIPGFMPHLKTITIQQKQSKNVIFYIGSHNLTKGAWGTISKGNKINIPNSELGVLFLNFDKQYLLRWLPFKYPPEKYYTTDVPYTSMQ